MDSPQTPIFNDSANILKLTRPNKSEKRKLNDLKDKQGSPKDGFVICQSFNS